LKIGQLGEILCLSKHQLASTDEKVRLAAEAIKAADALLVTAGAGMGVDSGLPDFRGTQGFLAGIPGHRQARPLVRGNGQPGVVKENPSWRGHFTVTG